MKNERNGFTLVELILVLALIGIVIAVSYSILFTGQKSFKVGINKGLAQGDNRILREYLVKELRYIKDVYNLPPKKEITTKYSSLEIISNDDGSKSILKTKNYNENQEIHTIPVKFDTFNMEINNGKTYIYFTPFKSGTKYEFTILLENNAVLNKGILSDSSKVMYYVYPQDIKK